MKRKDVVKANILKSNNDLNIHDLCGLRQLFSICEDCIVLQYSNSTMRLRLLLLYAGNPVALVHRKVTRLARTVIYFVISTPSAPTAYAWSAACASRQLLSSFTYLMRSDCDIVSAMKSTCAERTANGFRKKRRQSRRESRSGGVEGIVSGRHEQRRRERKEGSEEKKKKRREKRKEKGRGEGTLCAPDWWLRGTRRPTPTRTAGPRLGPMRTRRRKDRCTVHSCKNRTERHENSDRLMNCSWGKAKCGGGRAHIAAEDCEVLVAGDRVGSAE